MKKAVLFTIFFVLGICLSAQNFAINAYFSPNYVDNFLGDKNEEDIYYEYTKDLDEKLKYKFSFAAGCDFEYFLNETFSVSLGANYSNYNQSYNENLTIPLYPDTLRYIRDEQYNFAYLNIPLSLKYYFGEGKIKTYISLFGAYQFALKYNIAVELNYYELDNITTSSIDYVDDDYGFTIVRNNFVVGGGFGVTYDFSDNLRFYLEPNFQWYLLNYQRFKDFEDEISSPYHIYNAGCKFGLTYMF